jgi:hypothetical protein
VPLRRRRPDRPPDRARSPQEGPDSRAPAAATMGIWLSRMLSYFGDREARILVLGLDNAGKTTILCERRPNAGGARCSAALPRGGATRAGRPGPLPPYACSAIAARPRARASNRRDAQPDVTPTLQTGCRSARSCRQFQVRPSFHGAAAWSDPEPYPTASGWHRRTSQRGSWQPRAAGRDGGADQRRHPASCGSVPLPLLPPLCARFLPQPSASTLRP